MDLEHQLVTSDVNELNENASRAHSESVLPEPPQPTDLKPEGDGCRETVEAYPLEDGQNDIRYAPTTVPEKQDTLAKGVLVKDNVGEGYDEGTQKEDGGGDDMLTESESEREPLTCGCAYNEATIEKAQSRKRRKRRRRRRKTGGLSLSNEGFKADEEESESTEGEEIVKGEGEEKQRRILREGNAEILQSDANEYDLDLERACESPMIKDEQAEATHMVKNFVCRRTKRNQRRRERRKTARQLERERQEEEKKRLISMNERGKEGVEGEEEIGPEDRKREQDDECKGPGEGCPVGGEIEAQGNDIKETVNGELEVGNIYMKEECMPPAEMTHEGRDVELVESECGKDNNIELVPIASGPESDLERQHETWECGTEKAPEHGVKGMHIKDFERVDVLGQDGNVERGNEKEEREEPVEGDMAEVESMIQALKIEINQETDCIEDCVDITQREMQEERAGNEIEENDILHRSKMQNGDQERNESELCQVRGAGEREGEQREMPQSKCLEVSETRLEDEKTSNDESEALSSGPPSTLKTMIGEPYVFFSGQLGSCWPLNQYIIFKGEDKLFYLLFPQASFDGYLRWNRTLLNPNAPASASDTYILDVFNRSLPAHSTQSPTHNGIQNRTCFVGPIHPLCCSPFPESKRLLYRGDDGHIHELSYVFDTRGSEDEDNREEHMFEWDYRNLTRESGAPLASGDPKGYCVPIITEQGELRIRLQVLYAASDRSLHMLCADYCGGDERWEHTTLLDTAVPVTLRKRNKIEKVVENTILEEDITKSEKIEPRVSEFDKGEFSPLQDGVAGNESLSSQELDGTEVKQKDVSTTQTEEIEVLNQGTEQVIQLEDKDLSGEKLESASEEKEKDAHKGKKKKKKKRKEKKVRDKEEGKEKKDEYDIEDLKLTDNADASSLIEKLNVVDENLQNEKQEMIDNNKTASLPLKKRNDTISKTLREHLTRKLQKKRTGTEIGGLFKEKWNQWTSEREKKEEKAFSPPLFVPSISISHLISENLLNNLIFYTNRIVIIGRGVYLYL